MSFIHLVIQYVLSTCVYNFWPNARSRQRLGFSRVRKWEDNSFGKVKTFALWFPQTCHVLNSQPPQSALCQECLSQPLPLPVGLSSDQRALPLQSSFTWGWARWPSRKANTGSLSIWEEFVLTRGEWGWSEGKSAILSSAFFPLSLWAFTVNQT